MMKQPKLADLRKDEVQTQKIRGAMKRGKAVKITINVDRETLDAVKRMATDTGIPYQRLVNRLLKESMKRLADRETRLDRLERELNRMKRKLAA